MAAQIDILLATYNGEKFIRDQIDSILGQTFSDWRLLVRDDGSVDRTVGIVNEYSRSNPGKIKLIADGERRLGPVMSFHRLLKESDARYVAFCDQDDMWLPDKLRLLMKHMHMLESAHSPQCPILIHSDLSVVDERLNKLADSFWDYQNINPLKMQSFERLLVQNCVTGCATLVNRALIKRALPIPKEAVMHDWWFALIAAIWGRIEATDTKTVKYRQHAKNATGAKKWSLGYIIHTMMRGKQRINTGLAKTREQAEALLERGDLPANEAKTVALYINMFEMGWVSRRVTILRKRFIKYGIVRNLSLLLRV